MCDPDQDAAKHFRTKEEASSQHRMWGVGKHWPRHKLALNTETQMHNYLCWLAVAGWRDQTQAQSLQLNMCVCVLLTQGLACCTTLHNKVALRKHL